MSDIKIPEVPPNCKKLIDKLKSCYNYYELRNELSKIKKWYCDKSDLYHWRDVLRIFDNILEMASNKEKENKWCLPWDNPLYKDQKELLLYVLQFTALLIENSFSHHYYNSMNHLSALLLSSDMNVVVAVINVCHVFSRKTDYILRLKLDEQRNLFLHLSSLAESWGGKTNGFGLAECCQNFPITEYPSMASTLHFEFYDVRNDENYKEQKNDIVVLHFENIDKKNESPSQVMENVLKQRFVPENKRITLFDHIRMAYYFFNYPKRLLCIRARLQALSVLDNCNAVSLSNHIHDDEFIVELREVLEIEDRNLIEIKRICVSILNRMFPIKTPLTEFQKLKPILYLGCSKSKKKTVKWIEDDKLAQIVYFELDRAERINVYKLKKLKKRMKKAGIKSKCNSQIITQDSAIFPKRSAKTTPFAKKTFDHARDEQALRNELNEEIRRICASLFEKEPELK